MFNAKSGESADSLISSVGGLGRPPEHRQEGQGVRVEFEGLGVRVGEDVGGGVRGARVDVFEKVFDEGGGLGFLFGQVVVLAAGVGQLESVFEDFGHPTSLIFYVERAMLQEEELELLPDPPQIGVEEFDANVLILRFRAFLCVLHRPSR